MWIRKRRRDSSNRAECKLDRDRESREDLGRTAVKWWADTKWEWQWEKFEARSASGQGTGEMHGRVLSTARDAGSA